MELQRFRAHHSLHEPDKAYPRSIPSECRLDGPTFLYISNRDRDGLKAVVYYNPLQLVATPCGAGLSDMGPSTSVLSVSFQLREVEGAS